MRKVPGYILELARLNVADTYEQSYHKNAILSGDWDKGWLVQKECSRLMAENGIVPDNGAADA